MPRIADLVPSGFSLISPKPLEEIETQANPSLRDPSLTQEQKDALPQTVQLGTGRYYVIVRGPDGQQRALFLRPRPNPAGPGTGFQVPITGFNVDASGKPIGNAQLFTGDLSGIEWDQGGPISDVPKGAQAPSPIDKWVRVDATGKVVGPNQPAIAIMDPVTGDKIALPDPAKDPQGVVQAVGDYFVLIKPDGSSVTVTDENGQPRRKPTEKSQFNVAGIGLVEYDPATSTTKVLQAVAEKPEVLDPSKIIWTDIPGTDQQQANQILGGQMQPIAGYTRPAAEGRATTLLNDPNSRYLIWVNDKGQEVGRLEKPGWQPQREALTPNTVVGELPIYNPEKGQIEWVPNQNQIKASQAVSDLARGLGLTIGAGSMSEEQAQNLITSAVNSMNARTQALTGQAGAATAGLGQIQQAAQTGAGILQNRVSETSGLIQNLGGQLMGRQAPMLNIPSEESVRGMVQGATGMVTELGGGPGVYEAAANLVQRADPANRLGTDAAGMYAGLADAMGKFQAVTGRPAPLAQAVAQPMQQTGGFNPGAATPVPNPTAQPPPGMPKRIVQPKRPQAMAQAFQGLGSTTPGAAWNPNLLSAGMAQQAGMRAPVTININPT